MFSYEESLWEMLRDVVFLEQQLSLFFLDEAHLRTASREELSVGYPKAFASFGPQRLQVAVHPFGRFFTDKSFEYFFRLHYYSQIGIV